MISNDGLAVKYSISTYAQAVVDLNGGAVGVNTASSNSEYATASLGTGANNFAGRVTSCELKYRYIGTTFNQGGETAAYQDQDHNSLAGRSFATVNGEETSKKFPVDRTWTSILYRPVDSGDLDFFTALPLSSAPPVATDPSYYMGAVLQAPSGGVAAVFEWEAWATFEAYGQNIRAMTPSHADAVGFQAVHTVSQLSALLHPTRITEENREKQILLATAKHVATQSTISSSGVLWANNAFENAKRKDAKLAGIEGASGTAAGLAAGLVALNVLDFLF